MSYFNSVELNIFTFLQGERNIGKPIHKNFKELKSEMVERAVEMLVEELREYK